MAWWVWYHHCAQLIVLYTCVPIYQAEEMANSVNGNLRHIISETRHFAAVLFAPGDVEIDDGDGLPLQTHRHIVGDRQPCLVQALAAPVFTFAAVLPLDCPQAGRKCSRQPPCATRS